jgi:transposase-like protein
MVELRWPDGKIACPRCGAEKVSYLANTRVWKCYAKHPKPTFTLKTGTIFEDSPLGLDKWLPALWLVVNCKNGISSCEIARDLGVTQKTAWFMAHRLRFALTDGGFSLRSGEVEADETFIGGKARNMHVGKRQRRITGTGGKDKTAVMGLLERGGKVRTSVLPNRKRQVLQAEVDHALEYVNGKVHTNGLENFWSLLKRGISGTYVSVEPYHLFRYLDEQTFRYNNRKELDDAGRFTLALSRITGRRLTYRHLIGKEVEPLPPAPLVN